METRDYKQLKALLEKEGFEINMLGLDTKKNSFLINKKDPWEGVEFAERSDGKINRCEKSPVKNFMFIPGFATVAKHDLKPSTLEAYVEQLVEEGQRRFGDIKQGDRLDRSEMSMERQTLRDKTEPVITFGKIKSTYYYVKRLDELQFNCKVIYSNGIWAKKLPIRLGVTFYHSESIGGKYTFQFKVPTEKNLHHAGPYLAQELEKFLNKESNDN
jgi:hypothetical protein